MEYLQKYLIMIKKFLIKILWFFGRHTRIHLINRALTELNYNNILNSQKYSDDKNLIIRASSFSVQIDRQTCIGVND